MRSSSQTHGRARRLRRALSPPEVLIWVRLRSRDQGLSFRRQHPVGPYVADFYCAAAKLVVEIDGASHSEAAQEAHDARRDAYMLGLGLTVLRVPAAEVMADPDGAAQGMWDVAAALAARKR